MPAVAPAWLALGLTAKRDAVAAMITHVGFADDATVFAATQTRVNPSGLGKVVVRPATLTVVDASTFDRTVVLDGQSTDPDIVAFVNVDIATISACTGAAATNVATRTVRARTIGFEAFDRHTIGVRIAVEDTTGGVTP